MCIACELGFWSMIDALPDDARERILREQRERDEAARFACEAPEQEAAQDAAPTETPTAHERKP
jgi:hypothetical protein